MEQGKCSVIDLKGHRKLEGRLQMLKRLVMTNFHLEEIELTESILREMSEFVPQMNKRQKSLWDELLFISTEALLVTNGSVE
tara:strand:- start:3368 stop:3613 length:246 start_codon:yes stop_codon:yes gene_type:complete